MILASAIAAPASHARPLQPSLIPGRAAGATRGHHQLRLLGGHRRLGQRQGLAHPSLILAHPSPSPAHQSPGPAYSSPSLAHQSPSLAHPSWEVTLFPGIFLENEFFSDNLKSFVLVFSNLGCIFLENAISIFILEVDSESLSTLWKIEAPIRVPVREA